MDFSEIRENVPALAQELFKKLDFDMGENFYITKDGTTGTDTEANLKLRDDVLVIVSMRFFDWIPILSKWDLLKKDLNGNVKFNQMKDKSLIDEDVKSKFIKEVLEKKLNEELDYQQKESTENNFLASVLVLFFAGFGVLYFLREFIQISGEIFWGILLALPGFFLIIYWTKLEVEGPSSKAEATVRFILQIVFLLIIFAGVWFALQTVKDRFY